MQVRERLERLEEQVLSPHAQRSAKSRGRAQPEEESPVRTCFQRDRDRIIHSKAFRRLKDKTQVFIAPAGAHYRTRLTHTLEVSQIARTIAKALRLNEDLTEAIALGHDLGHPPFGHAGEEVLDEIHPGGFSHNRQSLRILDHLEGGGGLNLTWEVRDGVLNHPGQASPSTLEGQVIKLADRVAYVNHDLDDALRAGIVTLDEVPAVCRSFLGDRYGQRIDALVQDIIAASWEQPGIHISPQGRQALEELRSFLFHRVYVGSSAKTEEAKARRMLGELYRYYLEHPEALPPEPAQDLHQRVCDYVAGMTDHFAIAQYQRFFLPAPWHPGGGA